MANPITIEAKPGGVLAPKGEGRERPLKRGDSIKFLADAALAGVEVTFEQRSPFSDAIPHTFDYDTLQTVTKSHSPGGPNANTYTYVCREKGKAAIPGGGGEIVIVPEG